MHSPKSSKATQEDTSDSSSTRSVQVDEDDSVDMQSIQPVVQKPKINRSSPNAYISDISKPLPKNVVLECKMVREKRGLSLSYVYRLFGEERDPIFVAKTESNILATKFSVVDPNTGTVIGHIKSNFTSLNYVVTGPSCHFKIDYDENFLGRHGPRYFKVVFLDTDRSQVFILKPPIVINGDYYQDFHDLATVPSIKNFICVAQNNCCHEVCIFVRNKDDTFTLRISEPFSLFHGFCLALTSLHTGMFHR